MFAAYAETHGVGGAVVALRRTRSANLAQAARPGESGVIHVVNYDPEYPKAFLELRDRFASAVDDLTISIEHVGSTAVVWLAARLYWI
jgi:GrpB-like predicted nucleotidyltransferase (UPF0157 family)